eukprot:tig00000057_g48.t1
MWARSLGRLVGAGQRSVSGISAKQWRLGLVFPENARRPEPRLVPSKARAGDGVTPAAAGSAQAAAASATSVEPGTIAAPPKEPRVLTVYSTKQRACELTEEDAGKIFRIRDYKKAFPEGIAGKVDFENESDLGIMHRREAIEIFDALREVDKEVRAGKPSSKPGFCLTGSRGMGKSYILNSVVQAASDLGWFVIFIPEVFKLTEGRYAMQHSPTREGLWDIPEISQMFLKGIEARNKELLSKTKRTLEWPYGDIEDNLLGYTRLGIEEVEAAPEALLFLLDEIRALKDVPVLLAIDQYNAFYAMCKGYMDEEGKHLPPHIFTCFRPFVRFPDASIKQGMMIIATSEGWMVRGSLLSIEKRAEMGGAVLEKKELGGQESACEGRPSARRAPSDFDSH